MAKDIRHASFVLPPQAEQPVSGSQKTFQKKRVLATGAQAEQLTIESVFGCSGQESVTIARNLVERYATWDLSIVASGITLQRGTGETVIVRPGRGSVVVGYRDTRGVTKWATMQGTGDTPSFLPTLRTIGSGPESP